MGWYFWITIIAACLFLGWLFFNLIKLTLSGLPEDLSIPAGDVNKGIRYSFTGAMSPVKKESANLHLPTYLAGLCYHLGTFLSLGLSPVIISGIVIPFTLSLIIGSMIIISVGCGTGILIKRIIKEELRHFSTPDDYLSNILVTLFQIFTLILLIRGSAYTAYFIILSLLLIYIPISKLKHLLFFFAARIHLGNFFGRRGVWPPVNNIKKIK